MLNNKSPLYLSAKISAIIGRILSVYIVEKYCGYSLSGFLALLFTFSTVTLSIYPPFHKQFYYYLLDRNFQDDKRLIFNQLTIYLSALSFSVLFITLILSTFFHFYLSSISPSFTVPFIVVVLFLVGEKTFDECNRYLLVIQSQTKWVIINFARNILPLLMLVLLLIFNQFTSSSLFLSLLVICFSISSLLSLLVVPDRFSSVFSVCSYFRHSSLKSYFKLLLSAINIFSQINRNLLFKAWITNIVLIASVYSERFILFVVDPSLFTTFFFVLSFSQIIGYSYDTFITVPNRQKIITSDKVRGLCRLKFSACLFLSSILVYMVISTFSIFPSLVPPNTVIPYVFVASIFLSTTLNCISSLIQDFLFWKNKYLPISLFSSFYAILYFSALYFLHGDIYLLGCSLVVLSIVRLVYLFSIQPGPANGLSIR